MYELDQHEDELPLPMYELEEQLDESDSSS